MEGVQESYGLKRHRVQFLEAAPSAGNGATRGGEGQAST